MWIAGIEDGLEQAIPVASSVQVRAALHLGRLTPQDVVFGLYAGRIDLNGELVDGQAVPMRTDGPQSDGMFRYAGEMAVWRSRLQGITVRVRRSHPDLPVPLLPGLI